MLPAQADDLTTPGIYQNTVSYEVDGQTVQASAVGDGQLAPGQAIPDAPAGQIFSGWFTGEDADADGTPDTPFNPLTDTISADTTLTAKFTDQTLLVQFMVPDWSGVDDPVNQCPQPSQWQVLSSATVAQDSPMSAEQTAVDLPDAASPDGYFFTGNWTLDPTCDEQGQATFSLTTPITPELTDADVESGDNILTLYPVLTRGWYVWFNSMGGSPVQPETVLEEIGTPDGEDWPPTAPERDGYTFVGWYQDETCAGADTDLDPTGENSSPWPETCPTTGYFGAADSQPEPITQNTTLYARWAAQPVNYTVVYWLERPNVVPDIYPEPVWTGMGANGGVDENGDCIDPNQDAFRQTTRYRYGNSPTGSATGVSIPSTGATGAYPNGLNPATPGAADVACVVVTPDIRQMDEDGNPTVGVLSPAQMANQDTWNYMESETIQALAGQALIPPVASDDIPEDVRDAMQAALDPITGNIAPFAIDTTSGWPVGTFWSFSHTTASPNVAGDGSATINVYFTRRVLQLDFALVSAASPGLYSGGGGEDTAGGTVVSMTLPNGKTYPPVSEQIPTTRYSQSIGALSVIGKIGLDLKALNATPLAVLEADVTDPDTGELHPAGSMAVSARLPIYDEDGELTGYQPAKALTRAWADMSQTVLTVTPFTFSHGNSNADSFMNLGLGGPQDPADPNCPDAPASTCNGGNGWATLRSLWRTSGSSEMVTFNAYYAESLDQTSEYSTVPPNDWCQWALTNGTSGTPVILGGTYASTFTPCQPIPDGIDPSPAGIGTWALADRLYVEDTYSSDGTPMSEITTLNNPISSIPDDYKIFEPEVTWYMATAAPGGTDYSRAIMPTGFTPYTNWNTQNNGGDVSIWTGTQFRHLSGGNNIREGATGNTQPAHFFRYDFWFRNSYDLDFYSNGAPAYGTDDLGNPIVPSVPDTCTAFFDSVNNPDSLYSIGSPAGSIYGAIKFDSPLAGCEPVTPQAPDDGFGYNFAGWWRDPTFVSPVCWDASDTRCVDDDGNPNPYTMPSNNKILYAKWEKVPHTVEFFDSIRATTPIADLTLSDVPDGTVIADPSDTPDNPGGGLDDRADGATFIGWFIESGNGRLMPYDWTVPVTSDLQLYARWLQPATPVAVTYDANQVAGTTVSGTVPTDDTAYLAATSALTLDGTGLTRDGDPFIGWTIAGDDSGTLYYPGDIAALPAGTAGLTLVAQYGPVYPDVTVTFVENAPAVTAAAASLAVGDTSAVEADSVFEPIETTIDETPAVEESPVVEADPMVEPVEPPTDETPAVEEPPMVEADPVVEQEPVVEAPQSGGLETTTQVDEPDPVVEPNETTTDDDLVTLDSAAIALQSNDISIAVDDLVAKETATELVTTDQPSDLPDNFDTQVALEEGANEDPVVESDEDPMVEAPKADEIETTIGDDESVSTDLPEDEDPSIGAEETPVSVIDPEPSEVSTDVTGGEVVSRPALRAASTTEVRDAATDVLVAAAATGDETVTWNGAVLEATAVWPDNQTVDIDPADPTNPTVFAVDGYTFLGWSTDPDATSADQMYAYLGSTPLTATLLAGDQDGNDDGLTLYAVWQQAATSCVPAGQNGMQVDVQGPTVLADGSTVWTIVTRNNGCDPASNVRVPISIIGSDPDQWQVQTPSGTTTTGWTPNPNTPNRQDTTWQVGTVEPGQQQQVVITVPPNGVAPDGTLKITATTGDDNYQPGDPDPNKPGGQPNNSVGTDTDQWDSIIYVPTSPPPVPPADCTPGGVQVADLKVDVSTHQVITTGRYAGWAQWTVTAENAGCATASEVKVLLVIDGLNPTTWLYPTMTQGSHTDPVPYLNVAEHQTLTWNVGELKANATAKFVVLIPPTAVTHDGDICVTATITSPDDPYTGDPMDHSQQPNSTVGGDTDQWDYDGYTVIDPPACAAGSGWAPDLKVDVSKPVENADGTLTYTVTAKNAGGTTATSVKVPLIVDALKPATWSYGIPTGTSVTSPVASTAVRENQNLTWQVGDIAPCGVITLTITIPKSDVTWDGDICVTATIDSPDDPYKGNPYDRNQQENTGVDADTDQWDYYGWHAPKAATPVVKVQAPVTPPRTPAITPSVVPTPISRVVAQPMTRTGSCSALALLAAAALTAIGATLVTTRRRSTTAPRNNG